MSTIPLLPGEVFNEYLAPWTSWHIGGAAERFFSPSSAELLADYLSLLPPTLPVTWLGLGSNVLIRDGGIQGAVIGTRQMQRLYQREDGAVVAEAGVTCAKFARYCSRLGFPDAAFFAGIPGTIGGALAMNAGAFGGETWEWVEEIRVMSRQGISQLLTPKDYDIGYRSVKPKLTTSLGNVFVEGVFRFKKQENSDGLGDIKALLRKRSDTQPIGTLNCGSVYRNPPGDFAARLIEECQLKGYRVGDAMVSPKHANFIINCQKASAHDVEVLMATIESTVEEKFGIRLQTEVKILGRGDNNG
ncbi:MAG: UDP-N-acetylmuramate dehydrogenase [Candidatus Berkiella sp.]